MMNSRYFTRAKLISHNYPCMADRRQGESTNSELGDTDWVIFPFILKTEELKKDAIDLYLSQIPRLKFTNKSIGSLVGMRRGNELRIHA